MKTQNVYCCEIAAVRLRQGVAQTHVLKPNIYEKESKQNSNIYSSKVWIQLLQRLVHAVISTTVL